MSNFPRADEAEEALVGSAVIDPPGTFRACPHVTGSHFFDHELGKAWDGMREMQNKGETVDAVSASSFLDPERVAQCVLKAGPGHETYARLVVEAHERRSILTLAQSMANRAYNGDDPYQIRSGASQELRDMHAVVQRTVNMNDVVAGLSKELSQGGRATMPLPWRNLDWVIGGILAGEEVVLAARPGMGKTAMICQLVSWGLARGWKIFFHTMETSASGLVRRVALHRAGVDWMRFRRGLQTKEETDRLQVEYDMLAHAKNLRIVHGSMSAEEMRSIAREEADALGGLNLLVVDYLQRFQMPGKRNTVDELGDAVDVVKDTAVELACPVIMACQLRRLGTARPPTLEDLRDSGRIEQTADIVIGLYRQGYYDGNDTSGVASLVVLKNREGASSNETQLFWDAPNLAFRDKAP